jgi:AcrR family transcriptional regulator
MFFTFATMNDELNNILDKVLALYQKYGIKSITMDDVSRELGISKKTLYQYVTDKTDLVAKVLEHEMNFRKCEFEKINCCGMNAIEELIAVHKYINDKVKEHNPSTEYDLKKYYPDIFHKFNSERHQRMYEIILANIKKGKEQGLYRKEMNEEIIAKLTATRTEQLTGAEVSMVNEFTSMHFFAEVIIYHIRGIANEKGIKFLEENIHKIENNNVLNNL